MNVLYSCRGQMKAIRESRRVIQLGQACVNYLHHHDNSRHDGLLAVEKVLLQNLSDPEAPSALSQIRDQLKQDLEKPLNER